MKNSQITKDSMLSILSRIYVLTKDKSCHTDWRDLHVAKPVADLILHKLVRSNLLIPCDTSSETTEYEWNACYSAPNDSMAKRFVDEIEEICQNGGFRVKRCSKCGELKYESEFGKSNKEKSGLRCQCKECDKIEMRLRRSIQERQTDFPVEQLPAMQEISDKILVAELRRRGYDVTARKLIEL